MKKLFKITVKPEFLEECLGTITEHTIHVKSEPGCLVSEAYHSAADPRVVYLLSEFDTEEHERAHVESEADHAFIRKMQGKEDAPVEAIDWTQLA